MKVKIGVIDSGINENIVPGVFHVYKSDFDDFTDHLGHGTSCAQIILELCPDIEIYNLKVFDKKLLANSNNVINAINWCVENEIQIINLSLSIADLNYYYEFDEICEYAFRKNIFIIASADNIGRPCLPAYLNNVFGVGIAKLYERGDFFYISDNNIQLYTNGNTIASKIAPQQNEGTSSATARMTGIIANILMNHKGVCFDRLKELLAKNATPLDIDKILQINAPFDFKEQKKSITFNNNPNFDKLGSTSFVGMEREINQYKFYKDILSIKRYNFIEIGFDTTSENIRSLKDNFIIRTPQYKEVIQKTDSLIIGTIPEKACWEIIKYAESFNKEIYILDSNNFQKAIRNNFICENIYSKFLNKDTIINQIKELPPKFIIKNKIPILALINISSKNEIFELELKLKQKMNSLAYKATFISSNAKSILFNFDYSFADIHEIPINIQIPYVKCVIDFINKKKSESNLIIASINSFIPHCDSFDNHITNKIQDITLALGLSPDFVVCVIDDMIELEQINRCINLVKYFLNSKIIFFINNSFSDRLDLMGGVGKFIDCNILKQISDKKNEILKFELEDKHNIGLFNINNDIDIIVDSIINYIHN